MQYAINCDKCYQQRTCYKLILQGSRIKQCHTMLLCNELAVFHAHAARYQVHMYYQQFMELINHLIDIIQQNETQHMHPSFGSRISRDRDMVERERALDDEQRSVYVFREAFCFSLTGVCDKVACYQIIKHVVQVNMYRRKESNGTMIVLFYARC